MWEGEALVGLTLFVLRGLYSELSFVQCLEIDHCFIHLTQFTSCLR